MRWSSMNDYMIVSWNKNQKTVWVKFDEKYGKAPTNNVIGKMENVVGFLA